MFSLVSRRGAVAMRSAMSKRMTPVQAFRGFCQGLSQDSCGTHGHENIKRPSITEAAGMYRHHSELSNEALSLLAAQGDSGAIKERMVREIMHVDQVEWEEARAKVLEMNQENNKGGLLLGALPYYVGLSVPVIAAFASFPLCFHEPSVQWFNEVWVTAEVPPRSDLDTPLEVGAWAWNWMEPPLGQMSFFLLCVQFSRNQLLNLGYKPYGHHLKKLRADRLISMYPEYHQNIVRDFSSTRYLRHSRG